MDGGSVNPAATIGQEQVVMSQSRDFSDAELISASQRSPQLFAELFDRHAAEIMRFLARRIGPQDAEDALSQVFLTALERRAAFDPNATPGSSARPWLYGIASNVVSRRRRDEVRFLRALSRVPADAGVGIFDQEVVERLDAVDDVAKAADALAELSSGDRSVLLLLAWAQLTHEEIANALDIPVGTVKSRLHRARRELRRAFGDSASHVAATRSDHG